MLFLISLEMKLGESDGVREFLVIYIERYELRQHIYEDAAQSHEVLNAYVEQIRR